MKMCIKCKKIFHNEDCYEHHMLKDMCRSSMRCPFCGAIYSVKDNKRRGRRGHRCEDRYCRRCFSYHSKHEACYIVQKPVPPIKKARYVLYDIECTQDTKEGSGKFRHMPNFVGATVICTECIDSGKWNRSTTDGCEICGPHRTLAWSAAEFKDTPVCANFTTQTPLRDFVKWALYNLDKRYTSFTLAHYASKYDSVLVFREIFKLGGLKPSIIRQGKKLFRMVVEKKDAVVKTVFLDSYNFIQLPLSKLVKTFDLPVEEKRFFPHLYNKACNYNVTLPYLPPLTIRTTCTSLYIKIDMSVCPYPKKCPVL
jgi:hypothetical protein